MLRPSIVHRQLLPLISRTSSLTFSNHSRFLTSGDRTSDRVPTNDPKEPTPPPNVSSSNAVPLSPGGMQDSSKPLQEFPEDGERQRAMQAPNRATTWTRNQQSRERAMSGPRFEQTIFSMQVRLYQ